MTIKEDGYGLVLSGGGTKGSYEVGAWKALREMQIPIRGIVGSSIGALNAAMFLQKDPDLAESVYNNIQMSDILDVGESIDPSKNLLDSSNLHGLAKAFWREKGGISNAQLKSLIMEYIDVNAIYESPIEFGMMSFSIDDLTPVAVFKEDIPRVELINYLTASANFPIFKPEQLKGKRLVDGGVYDNAPVNMLISKGYRKMIVIDIGGLGIHRKVSDTEGIYIKKIRCDESLGGTFDFDSERIERNIQLGYLDTLKAFQRLQGHYYYFDINYFNKLLENFNLVEIYGLEMAAKLYGIEHLRIIREDHFLEQILKRHCTARAKLQKIWKTGLIANILKSPRQIVKLVESGMGIVWIEDLLRSWPAQDWTQLRRFFEDYTLAASAMIELEHYLDNQNLYKKNKNYSS